MKKIFNKIGLFNFNNDTFYGQIIKNNDNLEFSIINYQFNSKDIYLIVNGIIDDKDVSLIIFNESISGSFAKVDEEVFLINSLFIGQTFNRFDDLLFKKISIKIDNISSTMSKLSLFKYNHKDFENEFTPLIIKPQESYIVTFDDFILKFDLNFYRKRKLLGNGSYVNFKEDISIILEYAKKEEIKKIYQDLLIIKNLFTFITGKSKIIELKCLDTERGYNMILPIVSTETRNVSSYPSPIQLDESNINFIIKKWFENYIQLDYVYDLYFSLKNAYMNPTSLFLTYAQILESYHRKRYDGRYLDKKDFKLLNKKIKNCIKQLDELKDDKTNLKTKITSSISYSFEFTLKDRLIELFNDLSKYNLFKEILEKYNNISEFSSIVKDNRNYYTHYGNKKDNILDGVNLMEFNEDLRLIIDLIFLKEFGFSVDEINEITSKSANFRANKYFSWFNI